MKLKLNAVQIVDALLLPEENANAIKEPSAFEPQEFVSSFYVSSYRDKVPNLAEIWAGDSSEKLIEALKSLGAPRPCFVEICIVLAEKVLPNFEAKYPKDNRPRKAIEAAKNWLSNPSKENAAAAAAAADAAYAAAYAAAAAAYAAAYAAAAAADADAYAADADAAYAAAAAADAYAGISKQEICDIIRNTAIKYVPFLQDVAAKI